MDLLLLPFSDAEAAYRGYPYCAVDMLKCYPVFSLFDEILDIEKRYGYAVDSRFSVRGVDRRYMVVDRTPFNTHPMWVKAWFLKRLSDHDRVRGSYRNKAVWAYLNELADKHGVVLYWY